MAGKRISELDGLRGLAAISVLLYHYTSRFAAKFDINVITDHFNFKYGNYGVEVFFIISGFVIFMSIEKIKKPFEFVYKRFIRLYPTFWTCMLITYFFMFFFGPDVLKVNSKEFLVNFSMLSSLFGIRDVDGVYWTLKVEMGFYTLILILLLLRLTKKTMILGFIYIAFGLALLAFLRVPLNYYFGTLFLTGINFYQIWKEDGKWWNHAQIALCVFLSIFMAKEELIIVTSVSVGIFYLLIYGKLKFLSSKPLVFLGKISYALYLLHQYIGYSIQLKMIEAGITNYILLLIIPFTASLILASGVTFIIEKPLLEKLHNHYKVKYA